MKSHIQYRRSVWENNLAFIEQHNLDAAKGIHTFTVGMNEYGDLTTEEFVRYFNGFNISAISFNNIEEENDIKIVKDLPEKVDWRTEVNILVSHLCIYSTFHLSYKNYKKLYYFFQH